MMTFTQPDSSFPEKSLAPSELPIPLDDSSLYLNREFPWLEFKCLFCRKAHDKTTPLLEKLAFAGNSKSGRVLYDPYRWFDSSRFKDIVLLAPPSRAKKRCKKRMIISRS